LLSLIVRNWLLWRNRSMYWSVMKRVLNIRIKLRTKIKIKLRSRGRMLDWPQRASNGMRPSLRPVWSRALIGGANQLMVVGPCSAARIQKVERGWGHTRRSSLWPISLSHITLGPITEAQRRRESSTPVRVSGSHQIRWCSSSPSQRLADLLPLHRQEPLRRLQRCRVHQTSPLVRHANPKTLSVVLLLIFRPTRCRPSRSLNTNTSAFLSHGTPTPTL
jgi:hypothetical protein